MSTASNTSVPKEQYNAFITLRQRLSKTRKVFTQSVKSNIFLSNKKPISIIIYANEIEDYIEECLDSIEDQTYFIDNDKYEILIGVDACENTLEKLNEIKSKYRNVFIYFMPKHKGTYVTLNTLLDLIKFDHILHFNTEDIMKPEMIEEIMQYTDKYDLITFDYEDFNDTIDNIVHNKFWFNNGICFFNKTVNDLAGGYRDWVHAADLELISRVYNHVRVKDIEKSIFYKRQNDYDLKIIKNQRFRKAYEKQIKKYNFNENIKINKIVNQYIVIHDENEHERGKNAEPNIKRRVIRNQPISIIITAWQSQDYIEECLDSIENQIYFINNDKYEILIGVDACYDTLYKLSQIRRKYRNLRIFMMKENKGTYITSNTLLDLVKYKNILRFDSDDVMRLEMIEEIMRYINDYDVIKFKYCEFNEKISIIDKIVSMFPHGIVLFKQHVFDLAGGYRDWRCAADTELLNRISGHVKIKNIEDYLFYRRIHDNSLTKREDTKHGSKLRQNYKSLIKSYNSDLTTVNIKRITNEYTEY